MVATAERVGKVARIGGWGGGVWAIRAMPELKRFFWLWCRPLHVYLIDAQAILILYYKLASMTFIKAHNGQGLELSKNTNATNATMLPLLQAIWGYIGEKSNCC